MNTMNITVKNAALAESLGMAPGGTVAVACKKGVPVNREWRNRLKDSKLDGCVEIKPEKAAPPLPDKSSKKEDK
jgi:hypothetical protein